MCEGVNVRRCNNFVKKHFFKLNKARYSKHLKLFIDVTKITNLRGKELYEKGGTTKERMVEFLEKHIFPNYKDHLIILDNAKSHHNDMVKEAILKSGNKYLFSVPYTPKTNAIEMYFNQLKTYMKKARNIKSIQELETSVENSIKQIKQSNYKNYFDFAYGDKTQFSYTNKSSTRKRKLKLYKL